MTGALLKNVYLFKTLAPKELDAINEIAQSENFVAGDTIFVRGEAAKAMYFIKHGSVKIQQGTKSGDSLDVAQLSAGSHFGEMAFVDGEPRSASAIAAERTELIVVPYEKLQVFLTSNPAVAVKFYHELAHFLAGRLRVTTSDLSFAREKNLSHM